MRPRHHRPHRPTTRPRTAELTPQPGELQRSPAGNTTASARLRARVRPPRHWPQARQHDAPPVRSQLTVRPDSPGHAPVGHTASRALVSRGSPVTATTAAHFSAADHDRFHCSVRRRAGTFEAYRTHGVPAASSLLTSKHAGMARRSTGAVNVGLNRSGGLPRRQCETAVPAQRAVRGSLRPVFRRPRIEETQ